MTTERDLRRIAIAFAASFAMVLGLAPPVTDPMRAQDESPCRVAVQRQAHPFMLSAGETSRLSMRLRPDCPGPSITALDVILLFDSSNAAGTRLANAAVASSRQLVAGLDLAGNPNTRVGIASYDSGPGVFCGPTRDEARIQRCLDAVAARSVYAFESGLALGLRKVGSMYHGRGGNLAARKILIAFSGNRLEGGCDPAREEMADIVSFPSMIPFTICLGARCDVACLRDLVPLQWHFLEAQVPSEVATALQLIGGWIGGSDLELSLGTTRVTVELAPDVTLVEGSSEPAATVSDDGRSITWQLNGLFTAGHHLAVDLQANTPGYRLLTTETEFDFRDRRFLRGQATLGAGPPVYVFGGPP